MFSKCLAYISIGTPESYTVTIQNTSLWLQLLQAISWIYTTVCAEWSLSHLKHRIYLTLSKLFDLRRKKTHTLCDRCNILVHHHFPVHIGGMHKWKSHLSMSLGLCSTLFSMYSATYGVYRNEANVYIWPCGMVEYHASENATLESVGVEFNCAVCTSSCPW